MHPRNFTHITARMPARRPGVERGFAPESVGWSGKARAFLHSLSRPRVTRTVKNKKRKKIPPPDIFLLISRFLTNFFHCWFIARPWFRIGKYRERSQMHFEIKFTLSSQSSWLYATLYAPEIILKFIFTFLIRLVNVSFIDNVIHVTWCFINNVIWFMLGCLRVREKWNIFRLYEQKC